MKNSKKIIIFIIILVLIILSVVSIFSGTSEADTNKTVNTTNLEAEVSKQTIATTLTATGEVQSAVTEKIYLNTSYYYLTMCAEKNEIIKSGSNLLKYTNGVFITAPYDCVITSYSVPTAKEICTSSNYIEISSVDELYMNISINEEQINNISVGQEVEIVSNYDETKTFTGSITKINAIGTHSTGGTTFSAIASLENDGNLKLGMSATCTITIEKLEDVIALPIEAIQIENDKRYVNLIKDDGTTEQVEVETGKANENYVQITSGNLSEGDKVSYENVTVTVTEEDTDENSNNSLTSLFNFGGGNSNVKGGMNRQ